MTELLKTLKGLVNENSFNLAVVFGFLSLIFLSIFLYMVFAMDAPSDSHLTLLSMIPFSIFQLTAFSSGYLFYEFYYIPDTDWDEIK